MHDDGKDPAAAHMVVKFELQAPATQLTCTNFCLQADTVYASTKSGGYLQ